MHLGFISNCLQCNHAVSLPVGAFLPCGCHRQQPSHEVQMLDIEPDVEADLK